MRVWRRLLAYLAVALLVLTLSAVVAFDLLWLQPRLEQIETMAQSVSPEALYPPPLVAEMVQASEPDGLAWQVARILISQSKPPFKATNNLQWHTVGITSSLILLLHTTEQERLGLYSARIYVGDQTYGLEAAAQQLFSKNLSALSPKEAATVAAWPRAPNFFAKRPEALERLRDTLLKRVAEAN